jgi:hypothetical protein
VEVVMALNVDNIMSNIVSHAMSTGYFERVNMHEPKNAPPSGLSCAVWVERMSMIKGSGLSSASALLEFNVRIYTNMLQEPQDAIDPNMLLAADALYTAFAGDFELGSEARCIDLLGQEGTPLSAQAGYIRQDNKLYRVYTIVLPVIINDVWEEAS